MKRFLICLTVVFMALAFVNCKTGGEGSIALPGGGKFNLSDLFGKGKGKITEPELGDIDTEYKNWESEDYRTWLAKEMPDHRIVYGNDQVNYADLRIPKNDKLKTAAGYPVALLLHGGAWQATRPLERTAPLAEALTDFGIVTYNLEYRRLGNPGGGYPGSFQDIGRAVDFLRVLAPEYNLDLSRVIFVGFSSGGHLALWAAGRHKIDASSPLFVEDPLPLKGVVALAAIANMQVAYDGGRDDQWTFLDVTTAQDAAQRYPYTSPYHMLPTGVPTTHIVGDLDNQWRINGIHQYVDKSIELGTEARVSDLIGAGEQDVADPCGPAWPTIAQEVFWALGEPMPDTDLTKSKFCPIKGRGYAPHFDYP